MPLPRIYRVSLNYFRAVSFHVVKSTFQSRSRHPFPPVIAVSEETGYPPEIPMMRGSIVLHVLDTWQFLAWTELAPTNRFSAVIHDYSVRFPLHHQCMFLCFVLRSILIPPTFRDLIEHAPATTLHPTVFLE